MPPPSFLDLPAEIRYMIYQYLLSDLHNATSEAFTRARHPLLSLLMVCTLCRVEARLLFLRTAIFSLGNWKMWHRLTRFKHLELVKHVSVQLNKYPLHPTIIHSRIPGLEQLDYISDPFCIWPCIEDQDPGLIFIVVKQWINSIHRVRSHKAKVFTGREPYAVRIIARCRNEVSYKFSHPPSSN